MPPVPGLPTMTLVPRSPDPDDEESVDMQEEGGGDGAWIEGSVEGEASDSDYAPEPYAESGRAESPDPDYDIMAAQGDDDSDGAPDDCGEDWEGDEEGEGESEAEADPWALAGRGAGVVGDVPSDADDTDSDYEAEPDAGMELAGGGPGDSDDGEGEAGSDTEDTVRLIDAVAAREELSDMHPMLRVPTDAEVDALSLVVRNATGEIIDANHSRTPPWMTRFEKTRILGTRASQLSHDAPAQINVPDGMIDSMTIAQMELDQGQIAFVVRRPLPDGTSEYWPVHELLQIA